MTGDRQRVLGIETSCDETAAAIVERRHLGAVVGREQPGRPARPLRRRRARDRQPRPRRAHRPGRRAGVRRGRAVGPPVDGEAARSTRSPPPTGPGWSARCSSACRPAKALALAWDVPFVARQPPRGAPLRHLPRRARPRAARSWCCWCRAATRSRADGGPRPLPGARLDDRRRRRRGVRQGRPLPRARLPGRAGHRPAGRRRATRRRSGSRGRCSATAPTTSPSAG